MADTPQRGMLRIDDSLLKEIGYELSELTQSERTSLLKSIYETLELRVGMRLSRLMTNEQLDEFERFFNAKDDAGAFHWLEVNFPNYKEIVADEFSKLKNELAATKREAPPHVFICYSRNDKDIAQRLVEEFQRNDIMVWVDHEHVIPGAPDRDLVIRQNIKRSTGVVYIATKEAVTSTDVHDELAIARDYRIPIYALWARGDSWADCVPLGWSRTPYRDGRREKLDTAILAVVLVFAHSIIARLKKTRDDA